MGVRGVAPFPQQHAPPGIADEADLAVMSADPPVCLGAERGSTDAMQLERSTTRDG
jgi:hypothetical protein